jgi:hypothetical protein
MCNAFAPLLTPPDDTRISALKTRLMGAFNEGASMLMLSIGQPHQSV